MSGGLAEPGELVVCIDDRFPGQIWEWMTQKPLAGEVYTVARVTQAPHGITGIIGLAYDLEEFRHCGLGGARPLCFRVSRFRRLELSEEEMADDFVAIAGVVNAGGIR